MADRSEKIRAALRETAAEFLGREAGRQSLITVTDTSVSSDGRRGIIFITVLPEKDEESALHFANRNRGELGAFFKSRVRGIRMPQVEFRIDSGEKNRQQLDRLS
jgi:ribosome-binding factor A